MPTRCDVGPWRWTLLDSDLGHSEWCVAMALAARMNGDGTLPQEFSVGVRRLAKDTRLNKDTVAAALAGLVEAGWLEVVREPAGRRPGNYATALPESLRPNSGDTIASELRGRNGEGPDPVVSGSADVVSQSDPSCVRTQGTPPALPAQTSTGDERPMWKDDQGRFHVAAS